MIMYVECVGNGHGILLSMMVLGDVKIVMLGILRFIESIEH